MTGWPATWPAWLIRDLLCMLRRGRAPLEDVVRHAARRWAVARRWDADRQGCECGAWILVRWERRWAYPPASARGAAPKQYATPVRLNMDGREHACPTTR